MGETDNIKLAGEAAFRQIFATFGWKDRALYNSTFPCITAHAVAGPKSKSKPEHPTDGVFYYEDPYTGADVYLSADFKSYAKTSLETLDIAATLRSLANTIECAAKSEEYKKRFFVAADGAPPGEVVGLLFAFNHDKLYSPEAWRKRMGDVDETALDCAKNRRMYVVGPDQIMYLQTVANDIDRTKGRYEGYKRSFFYPDLIGKLTASTEALAIETLLGPIQIVKLSGATTVTVQREGKPETLSVPDTRYDVYVRLRKHEVDDYEYLLDSFFRYQLVDENVTIYVHAYEPASDAPATFERAKEKYLSRFYDVPEFKTRLARVKY